MSTPSTAPVARIKPTPDAEDSAAIRAAAADFQRAAAAVRETVRGKDAAVELALIAVVAGGHVLLEDVPGVGKTTLASALAAALGGVLRRIQFTSDLLPGDITGVPVLEAGGFRFRPGPIFGNIVLADEINRATPKTQSALLEAMTERQVTVDGERHPLPSPFAVLATQNPTDHHSTFALPDSQLDRFFVRLSMGYPDREHEREILRSGGLRAARFPAALSLAETAALCAAVDRVAVHPDVEDLLLELVSRTRSDARLLRGVSTRGAEALLRACRARALGQARAFVIPDDLLGLAQAVLGHRVLPRVEGERGGGERAVRAILAEVFGG
ncbi:MAG: MoxR family ATPase [Deltaproteobacteria bacterium]|nr:MoxR family ATPase [Deltaproteobacteria bacterium]